MDKLIDESVERLRKENEEYSPVDAKEEKRNGQCFKCVRHRTNYSDDGGNDSKFCGPDPTTWYYHECTLKPETTGTNKYQNCMHVNRDGECKDFQPSGVVFKPEWTYRDLDQYRKYLEDRHARMDRERMVPVSYPSRTPKATTIKSLDAGELLVIVGIIILIALAVS